MRRPNQSRPCTAGSDGRQQQLAVSGICENLCTRMRRTAPTPDKQQAGSTKVMRPNREATAPPIMRTLTDESVRQFENELPLLEAVLHIFLVQKKVVTAVKELLTPL